MKLKMIFFVACAAFHCIWGISVWADSTAPSDECVDPTYVALIEFTEAKYQEALGREAETIMVIENTQIEIGNGKTLAYPSTAVLALGAGLGLGKLGARLKVSKAVGFGVGATLVPFFLQSISKAKVEAFTEEMNAVETVYTRDDVKVSANTLAEHIEKYFDQFSIAHDQVKALHQNTLSKMEKRLYTLGWDRLRIAQINLKEAQTHRYLFKLEADVAKRTSEELLSLCRAM